MNTRSVCFSKIARIVLMLSTLLIAAVFSSTTNAAEGCGAGKHRSYYGGCIWNHGGYGYQHCWWTWHGRRCN